MIAYALGIGIISQIYVQIAIWTHVTPTHKKQIFVNHLWSLKNAQSKLIALNKKTLTVQVNNHYIKTKIVVNKISAYHCLTCAMMKEMIYK